MQLLRRRQCLVPTLYGWLLILVLLAAGGYLFVTRVHAYLAPTHAVGQGALVIEGWMSESRLQQVLELAHRGRYRMIITTGGPIGRRGNLTSFHDYAHLSLASLKRMGVGLPVFAVPAPAVQRDRTFAAARALKHWLAEHDPKLHEFDLVSVGPHARRSWLLYREAFGDGFDIGIIALKNPNYDPTRWWHSSAGVRTVIGEVIAWVYADLVFSPPKDGDGNAR